MFESLHRRVSVSELNFKLDSNSAFAPLPSSFAPTGEFEAASNDELDSKDSSSMEIELAVIAAPPDATKNGLPNTPFKSVPAP